MTNTQRDINEVCSALACLALIYELTIGDDTGNRAASEGSYYDALNTWQIYANYCICNPDAGQEPWRQVCNIILDKLVKRMKDYLGIWGAMENRVKRINLKAFYDFAENILAPVYRNHCSSSPDPRSLNYVQEATRIFDEAWSRFSKRKRELRELYDNFGETAFFKLLHMAFPELPPFDGRVCSFYRRDKNGGCSSIDKAYLDHLRAVHGLAQLCGCYSLLQPLLSHKTFAKVLDQAVWLAHRETLCDKKKDEARKLLALFEKKGLCPRDAARVLCEYLMKHGKEGGPSPCFAGQCPSDR